MPKSKSQFACQVCGMVSPRWLGKCPSCSSWNSFVEEMAAVASARPIAKLVPQTISAALTQTERTRLSTAMPQIDMILGGGLMPGSVVLFSGEPGIGKSTLIMQIAHNIALSKEAVYISSEESGPQIASRAERLFGPDQHLKIVSSGDSDDISQAISDNHWPFVVVDSIQALATTKLPQIPGSISQVNYASHQIIRAAKASSTAVVIIGHVTKEGNIAGPKMLEHIVDVTLNLGGDRYSTFRVLRSLKNRFGPTDEMVMLDMTVKGLVPVENPSETLLKEREKGDGSIVLASMEGTRPVLVEVQALVHPTTFGYPKRTAVGFDLNRLNLLAAMMSQRTKLDLSGYDVYLNMVGGFKIKDAGADLAICLAIATAAKSIPIKGDAAVFGEVGLRGEVRHVPGGESRISEAVKLGFKYVIGPRNIKSALPSYIGVANLREAFIKALKGD